MVTKAQTRIGSTRLTKNYKRTRLASPTKFNSFKTVGKGKVKYVMGKDKRTGKWMKQARLVRRK